eukprot:3197860-Prymnesium_polylepis.1
MLCSKGAAINQAADKEVVHVRNGGDLWSGLGLAPVCPYRFYLGVTRYTCHELSFRYTFKDLSLSCLTRTGRRATWAAHGDYLL